MNKDLLGYVVDVAGITSLTILGALGVLPAEIIMSGLMVILVGRIRPPTPPSAPGGALATSGLVAGVAAFGVVASRLLLVRRFA